MSGHYRDRGVPLGVELLFLLLVHTHWLLWLCGLSDFCLVNSYFSICRFLVVVHRVCQKSSSMSVLNCSIFCLKWNHCHNVDCSMVLLLICFHEVQFCQNVLLFLFLVSNICQFYICLCLLISVTAAYDQGGTENPVGLFYG